MTLTYDHHGEGRPVILVNGAAPLAWGRLPRLLIDAGRSVITYARRGFPPNDDAGMADSIRAHTDDLAEILEQTGRATVVGWSSGGVVSLDLGLVRPDLVSRLVVIEPPLHATLRPTPSQLRAVLGALLRRRRPEAAARRFLHWAMGRTDGSSDVDRLDPTELRSAAPAIVNELAYATGERDVRRSDLQALAVPTTWLVGDAGIAGNRRLAERAARIVPAITVRNVEGAGHAIALDAPEAVVDSVVA